MPRFIPAEQVSQTPQTASRFIPASSAQLPAGPQGDPTGGGMDVGDMFGMARSGVSAAGTAGRFLDVPGAGALSSLGGPLQLGQGIATGNPMSIAQGAINTGTTLGGLWGNAAGAAGLGGGIGGLIGGGLGGGAGGAGVALGGAGAYGALTPSLVAGGGYGGAIGGGAVGGAAAAGGGIGGSGGAAAAGLGATLGGLSTVMAPIMMVAAIAYMNSMHQEQKRIENQTQESGTIRQEYASAVPSLLSAVQAAKQAMTLQGLPPDQQQAMLATILPQLEAGIGTISPITRFIFTQGQGGGGSLTKPADTSQAAAGFPPAIQETMLGYLYASDAAARMGMPVEQIPGQGRDPAAIMNTLMQGTFNPYLQNIDYSQVGPGNQVDFVRQQLEAADPNFAASALGQQLAALPAVPGTFDPAAAQQAALERQQTAEMQIQNVIGQQQGTDLDAVAYAAPYAGGLEENLMSLIPRTMPQEEGMAIIQDLLSRGASPVLIRSGLQERAEQRGYF